MNDLRSILIVKNTGKSFCIIIDVVKVKRCDAIFLSK